MSYLVHFFVLVLFLIQYCNVTGVKNETTDEGSSELNSTNGTVLDIPTFPSNGVSVFSSLSITSIASKILIVVIILIIIIACYLLIRYFRLQRRQSRLSRYHRLQKTTEPIEVIDNEDEITVYEKE